ncbi:MAG: NAD(P)-dependent alcohol dehydrogenase [Bdellovibrionales bacterium]|nr:NAD(P)-dependent alcohol dehydrogenase [Bdellovibrionales bacterium]
MRSVYRTKYGPPESLQIKDIQRPIPKSDEILVRVYATTVNRTDCGGLRGEPFVYRFFAGFPHPRHKATGSDFAGEVAAVGSEVKDYEVGDRVFGFDDNSLGSHAQYMTCSIKTAIQKIPDGVSYPDAAASLEGAHYALNFMNKINLNPEDRVLVNGATGAIGSAAVQLLKYIGVHVTAVCGGDHIEKVARLGADRVIDYSQEDFTKTGERYHFIFDAVGKSTFGLCRKIILPTGAYISSELGPYGQNLVLPISTRFSGGPKVIFPLPYDIRVSVAHMAKLLREGRFKPLIDRSYSLDQVREAFEYVSSGQKTGNVVLLP